jgi:hypothetical protein
MRARRLQTALVRHISLLALVMCSPTLVLATGSECKLWKKVAVSMAMRRDAGMPYKEELKKMKGVEGKPGVTSENTKLLRSIAENVYLDFPDKTPAEIGDLHYAFCMATE